MHDLLLTSWYTEPGFCLASITGPTVGAGRSHLVYRLTLLHGVLHDVVADHQRHVGVAGLLVNVLSPPTALETKYIKVEGR